MTSLAIASTADAAAPATRRWFSSDRAEPLLLGFALVSMVVLPVVEMVLRRLELRGIGASTSIVQHGTLLVSVVGASIAARRGRLLSIATAALLPTRVQPAAAAVAGAGAAAVSALLAAGSLLFVLAERQAGATLWAGVPLWLFAAVLPIGFLLIAVRLAIGASPSRLGRAAVSVAALAAAIAVARIEVPSRVLAGAAFGGVALLAAAGAPIFAVLGGAALIAYWATEIPIGALAVSHYSLVVNPTLPAIPLFTLAGYVLAQGGASRRLVRVFDALTGAVRGGPAVVTVLACAFFTTFTGGSGITILALGGLLFPILIQARYSERNALGLITGAGALGILFPPCLPLILYAVAAGVDVNRLFLAGVVPGVLLLALTIGLGWYQQPPVPERRRFDAVEVRRAIWAAKWECLLPVMVIVLLFGGFATAVEAAAVTALFALFSEIVIHRDYRRPSQVLEVFTDAGVLVGGVLLILGVALGLTGFLVDAEVPQRAAEWVTATVHSPLLFLLLLNLFLIVVGATMDIYSAIIVVVPLIIPLGAAFGIDPIHLGIIFLANLELGYLVPPVGENLFISAYRFNQPIGALARAVLPIVGVFIVGVLAITYIPGLSLWLVRALAP